MKPKFGIIIFYYFLKFLHLIPFSLNLNNFNAKPSMKSILWSVVFGAACLIHELFIGNFAYKLRNGSSYGVEVKYSDLFLPATIMLLICIFWNFIKNKLSFKLIKRSKIIFHKISGFGVSWNYQHKINIFLLKYFTTQLINLTVDYFYYFSFTNLPVILIIIYSPVIGFRLMISSAILMKSDLLLILLKNSFSQINKIINEKFVKIRNQQNDDMQREDIEELIEIYWNLCKIYKMIMDLIFIPVLLIIGFNFLVVENAFLLLYENLKGELGFFRSFINLLWVFFKVRDVYFVFKDGSGVLKKVSK